MLVLECKHAETFDKRINHLKIIEQNRFLAIASY